MSDWATATDSNTTFSAREFMSNRREKLEKERKELSKQLDDLAGCFVRAGIASDPVTGYCRSTFASEDRSVFRAAMTRDPQSKRGFVKYCCMRQDRWPDLAALTGKTEAEIEKLSQRVLAAGL